MSLKDTILKYHSQFIDVCDENFKFAEYFGPTIIKEMSDESLHKRCSNVIYRMQYGSEKSITVFDMIAIGEYAMRTIYSVAEKKNTEEYDAYRLEEIRIVSRLIQIALRGSNCYRKNSYAASIYNTIMRILNSIILNISGLNQTKEDEETDYMVSENMMVLDFPTAFRNEISSINAERSYDDDMANHAFNIHKTLIALFGFNYAFYSILDLKQFQKKFIPYTWDEFVNKLNEAMTNDNVGNDTLYQILAYYNCVCLGNRSKIEFLKKFVSDQSVDKTSMGAENESMTMEQYICSFIDTE